MTTMKEQVELEKRMVAYGISRYRHSITTAEVGGRAADTRYSQALMKEFIAPIAEAIEAYNNSTRTGVKAKYRVLLKQVEPMKAAYFGLRCLFNHFTVESSLHRLAGHIGTMIEDEIKFAKFHKQHGEYYEAIIKDFERKGTKNYRHMHRVLTHKANGKDVRWASWGLDDKVSVGTKVIDVILSTTDLIEKKVSRKRGKMIVEIMPSASALKWVQDFNKYAELLNPDRVPCVIQPEDWTGLHEGGYYTPQLRYRTPMVKTRSPVHKAMFDGDIENVTSALNAIQRVPWQINQDVYNVFKQAWDMSLPIGLPQSEPFVLPTSPVAGKKKAEFTADDKVAFDDWKTEARIVHTMERDRVSKCFQVVRVMRLATEFKDYDRFWFVYQCDFRGRIYATVSGMSPQGPDYSKSLLRFANGKPLTERGAFWLAVHGANCYGEDKVSYKDRHKWVIRNSDNIRRAAQSPLDNTEFWGNADKPWQFLAFCFEYSRYMQEGPEMLSYLPIGLDGSCNGLQNFSAMLRDSIGGKATNLVPQEVPSDIYQEVAKVCTDKLQAHTGEMADAWLAFAKSVGGVLPRGLAKRPVMTLPYGSTVQSCRDYIYKYMAEDAPEHFPKETRFKMSSYLTPILWASIADVVVAARQAMDWLQKSASTVAKTNNSIMWWTPLGFPVIQDRKTINIERVRTELAGKIQLRIGSQSNKMDVLKNKLAIAPNFVHSMDACHLMQTCLKAVEYGVTDFAFIHDDYGTHAADTDIMHRSIREAFIDLYGTNDPLVDFKIFNEDNAGITLNDPPIKGSLNLGQVIDSKYFFG